MSFMVILHVLVLLEFISAAPLGPDDIGTRVNQLEHEMSLLQTNGDLGGSQAVGKDRLAELEEQLAAVHKQWDSLQSEMQGNSEEEENEENEYPAAQSIYDTNNGTVILNFTIFSCLFQISQTFSNNYNNYKPTVYVCVSVPS